MRRSLFVLFVILGGLLGLSSCETTGFRAPQDGGISNPQAELAFFKALGDRVPAAAPATESELRQVLELLSAKMGGGVSLSYGEIATNDAGSVANDVVFSLIADKKAGIAIDELRLWGANVEALTALTESAEGVDTARVADRIELLGLSVFGIEVLMNSAMDGYIGLLEDSFGELESEEDVFESSDILPNFGRYEFTTERLLIDGLVLYPIEFPEVDKAMEADPLMGLLQAFAAMNRSFGFDASVSYGMTGNFSITQMFEETRMNVSAPFSGSRGWRQGSLDFTVTEGMSFDMTGSVTEDVAKDPDVAVFSNPFLVDTQSTYAIYAIENLKLEKAYEFLARGEIPPTSETNILSFGKWRIIGEEQRVADSLFYSIGDQVVDFSQFHWLVPTRIYAKVDDATYYVEGFEEYFRAMMSMFPEESGPTEIENQEQLIADIIGVLEKYDFTAPVTDMVFDFSWDPSSGSGAVSMISDTVDFGRSDFASKWNGASFDAFVALMPDDGEEFDQQEFAELMKNSFALKQLSLQLDDSGGLAKTFGMIVDFAKLMPEEEQGAVAMVRNMDADGLREFVSSSIRVSASGVAQIFPPAKDYVFALADYISQGGRFRVDVDPPVPVSQNLVIDATADPGFTPASFAEIFNITVVHELPVAE